MEKSYETMHMQKLRKPEMKGATTPQFGPAWTTPRRMLTPPFLKKRKRSSSVYVCRWHSCEAQFERCQDLIQHTVHTHCTQDMSFGKGNLSRRSTMSNYSSPPKSHGQRKKRLSANQTLSDNELVICRWDNCKHKSVLKCCLPSHIQSHILSEHNMYQQGPMSLLWFSLTERLTTLTSF
jgi:hypothetical protein